MSFIKIVNPHAQSCTISKNGMLQQKLPGIVIFMKLFNLLYIKLGQAVIGI